ncbi:hypothetical protein FJY63_15060, partial [Candidatus Sumerlaeota bacterium]|nr:hypothetical protein [Candidatus Sumerlaeota bacterium]
MGNPGDSTRVTLTIAERLQVSLEGWQTGFKIRWRIDPIFTVVGWQDIYSAFFANAARAGHRPSRITLGAYRETHRNPHIFSRGWGLPPLEWKPPQLTKDGDHFHINTADRIRTYSFLADAIRTARQNT